MKKPFLKKRWLFAIMTSCYFLSAYLYFNRTYVPEKGQIYTDGKTKIEHKQITEK